MGSRTWVVYWTIIVGALTLAVLAWVPAANMEAFSKVLGALAPVVTVSLAIFGLYAWRLQLVAKRRFELAEEGLSATIAVTMALDAVRSPLMFSGEGSTRSPEPNETPKRTENLNYEFVPIERLGRYKDEFTALEKCAIILEVHFGKSVTNHMWDILRARNKIHAAVITRRGMNREFLSDANTKTLNMLEAVIMATGDTSNADLSRRDVLSGEIVASKERLMVALRPYLEEPRLWDVFRLSTKPISTPPTST